MKRAWLGVALALGLSGCSSVQVAYHQLDWLIPLYVRGYVSLTADQRQQLDQGLAELQHWHCSSALPAYADWLRTANAEIQAGGVTAARVDHYISRFQGFWKELMQRVGQGTAAIAITATDTQVEEFFQRLDRDNAKYRTESVDPPLTELRQEHIRRMETQLERWIGELSPAQQRLVSDWSTDFVPIGAERLGAREHWQGELRRLLQQRADTPGFRQDLSRLLAQPERYWTVGYRQKIETNRTRTANLLAAIGATLTPEQRLYLAQRAGSWARDFDRLTCTGERPVPAGRT
jgi:hypothetical protein